MCKKIRILYIVSTLGKSGPTNQLFGLIRNLYSEKYEIKVLTLSLEPKESCIEDFKNLGIQVETLGLSRIAFQLKDKLYLNKYIEMFNADIIHTSGFRANVAVSKLFLTSSHCTTIHNFANEDFILQYGNILGKWAIKKYLNVIETCEYVICCSYSISKKYKETILNHLYVVQNGVEVGIFQPPRNVQIKNKIRRKLFIPIDKKIFIISGVLIGRKDPLTIINAFKKANIDHSAQLWVLGDGEMMKSCQSIADDSVVFKGRVSNVVEYLQASDVYISASKSEGLPYSVLEAGRCGLNIILSDIMQHREIFEDLDYASFFEVGNSTMLADIIKKYVDSDEMKTNYVLAEYIGSQFSSKVMAEGYEEIYDMMIK